MANASNNALLILLKILIINAKNADKIVRHAAINLLMNV